LNEVAGFMQSWLCKSAVILPATIGTTLTSGPAKFDGAFVDKKFLNGQGVFQFSVHQSSNALDIGFDAAYSDGHGATLMPPGRARSTATPRSSPGKTVTVIPERARSVSPATTLSYR
jgi:hypothetical protein